MAERYNCTTNPCAPCRISKVEIGKGALLAALDSVYTQLQPPHPSALTEEQVIETAVGVTGYNVPLPDANELVADNLRIMQENNCIPRPL